MKRIIIVRGVENTNKTTNIIEVYNWIISRDYELIDEVKENVHGDISGIIRIGNLIIGINSSGDNLEEASKVENLKDSEGNYPDIIICATRTRGVSHKYFNENFGYSQGWLKIYQNVRQHDSPLGRDERNIRVIEEIKARLIGLSKQ